MGPIMLDLRVAVERRGLMNKIFSTGFSPGLKAALFCLIVMYLAVAATLGYRLSRERFANVHLGRLPQRLSTEIITIGVSLLFAVFMVPTVICYTVWGMVRCCRTLFAGAYERHWCIYRGRKNGRPNHDRVDEEQPEQQPQPQPQQHQEQEQGQHQDQHQQPSSNNDNGSDSDGQSPTLTPAPSLSDGDSTISSSSSSTIVARSFTIVTLGQGVPAPAAFTATLAPATFGEAPGPDPEAAGLDDAPSGGRAHLLSDLGVRRPRRVRFLD